MDVEQKREKLWRTYMENKSEETYQELVGSYLPLVRYISSRMSFRLPNHLEKEDLVGYGIFGLMEALKKFDPARGVKFETYASQRIRGSILDALRHEQWAPRSVTDKLKELQRAYQKFESSGETDYSESELAQEMGLNVKELRRVISEINQLTVTSLEDFLQGCDFETISLGDTLADPNSPNPLANVLEEEFRDRLAEAIGTLPEKDRLVISLYYYEELTLREIGEILGVSESRVSQLHARALMKLRSRLSEYVTT